jgi:hypothetical protein
MGQKERVEPWAHLAYRPQTFNEAISLFKPRALDGCNVAVIGGQRTTRTRSYTALLDIDNPDALDRLCVAARKACAGADLAFMRTGRGYDLVMRSHEPLATTKHAAGELRGAGAYAVVPPSLHPNGLHYEWLRYPERIPIIRDYRPLRDAGIDIRPAFERLGAVAATPAPIADPGDFNQLPRLARAIMADDPQTIGRYQSRSEVDWTLYVTLANTGMNADTITGWAMRSKHAAHWRNKKDAVRYLHLDVLRAMQWAQLNMSHEYQHAQHTARDMRIYAFNTPWHAAGQTRGETLRATWLAHADTVARVGRTTYQLSRRDGATRAHTGGDTFSKATQQLTRTTALRTTQRADRHNAKAAHYTIDNATMMQMMKGCRQDLCGADAPEQNSPNVREWPIRNINTLDVFEHKGLGKSAGAIYASLLSGIDTQAALAQRTGRAQGTVAKKLTVLEKYGLAQRTGTTATGARGRSVTTWAGIERDADYMVKIAKALGVHGRGARRAIEHKAQQRAYADYVRTRNVAGARLATKRSKRTR